MPPKVTDTRNNSAESLHAVAEETAAAARRIVATYSDDFFDFATLACMLGVELKDLRYGPIAAEHAEAQAPKKATKKAAKKTTKKATKKAAKKTTKKATKKAAKKTTKKAAKKAAD
ncbi:hypothetical protein C1Y63_05755 [Corynebacterium sp. 13CS0277]|uniref:hypothetical protein n=1 Tax=Corynebacterium sp. 13CS0277 TaxID=2071994 RepID=UPI000D03B30D|nr:hypothetical protein [Corynebacterium sp. 13CS0277]PRQ11506.1 hypothetical protein C1Y63_05755 [Corynebacterium sp. 13CS0277]